MADPIRNFFKSQLIGEYSNTATSFTISTGDGALLPDPSVDGEYNLVIFEGTAGSSADEFEVVRVTAKSSDTLTVTRGQESTTPITVTSAFHSIIMAATKKTFDDINDAIDNVDLTSLTGVEELTFDTTGDEEFGLPAGTTSQRPASPSAGYMRYNTETAKLEVYSGGVWGLVSLENVRAMEVAQATVTANDAVAENLIEVEYLVIAGGGGGSDTAGGGAGGYRSSVAGESSGGGSSAESPLGITTGTSVTVTVGAGGTGGVNDGAGTNGANSVFSTITSIGGGTGAAFNLDNAATGGSGGGGSIGNGGSGTTNQGYAGGAGLGSTVDPYSGGGGGGAGAVGTVGDGTQGGNGGDGVQSSITGTAVYRAGGGGGQSWASVGGLGGNGGGGNGSVGDPRIQISTAGTDNTGGGGGGGDSDRGGSSYLPKNGGSGVVILRYPSSVSITIGAGLTGSETTDGSEKYAVITAGTGNVSWS